MHARDVLLQQHGWVHAAEVSGAPQPTTLDRLLEGLTEDQLRARPGAELNPLAWLLWHMARIEDATVNGIVAGTAQVIEEDGWAERLGVAGLALGTGMADDEVGALTARLRIDAVTAYRTAVGRRTRELMRLWPEDRWTEPVAPEQARRAAAAATGGAADSLGGAWSDWPAWRFFAMPAVGHSFLHLGEGWTVRALLGAGGGR